MMSKDPEWERFNVSLSDGGPFYTETNLRHFIVEPWNAFSSLTFLIPAIYWLWKIRKNLRNYGFIAYCIPLLVLGGLGSTFFHAFRSSEILLWMDVLPILILTLSVSTYFWHKVYDNWIVTIVTMILSFLGRRLILTVPGIPVHTAINISYAIGGVTIFLPVLLILIKTTFKKFGVVFLSVICFITSLIFREIDARSIHALPMGTHFLWHVFSAVGAFFLASYLYFINDFDIHKLSSPKENILTSEPKIRTMERQFEKMG
jgi:hypothetical protein